MKQAERNRGNKQITIPWEQYRQTEETLFRTKEISELVKKGKELITHVLRFWKLLKSLFKYKGGERKEQRIG